MKKFLFLIQKAPFKSESPKLGLTHSLASYVAVIHIDEEIEPVATFVGEGVLNCIKNQKLEQFYALKSNEDHIKQMLLSDMKVLACKEDLEKFNLNEERLIDAKDLGSETTIKIVPFEEILKEMETSDHIMVF